jgi:UDP-N-acetylglucosamine 2-epimerase (non-hydrolysing)
LELLQSQNRNNNTFDCQTTVEKSSSASNTSNCKILVLFGTRPEIIKLAPVIRELKSKNFQTVVVSSGQHTDLLAPFLQLLEIEVDYNLNVMTENQTPNQVLSKVLSALDEILEAEKPDIILVQGDTTTTLAGALAGFNREIPIGHVEAGLRSGNLQSPFPEEMNRRIISQIAAFNFCATTGNCRNLLNEKIAENQIFVTGNTVVDSLQFILKNSRASAQTRKLISETKNLKQILLTTHRRESFGAAMRENLLELRRFVKNHQDVCLIFPVHPNPNVKSATEEILAHRERIFLIEPVGYADFVALMKSAWLIVSDSGGVQEEAPSLGKPLLVLRENTERPEAIDAGTAKLVGKSAKNLAKLLKENYNNEGWINSIGKIENPFGTGDSAKKIVEILTQQINSKVQTQEENPLPQI